MMDRIGSFDFVAEPFHVDSMERLTLGVLGNHLLNCAGMHAAERGFGMTVLHENRYTWVLSRLAIELSDLPRAYEKFTIRTWVENVYRLFTDRNFMLLDKDGRAIGYARSIWAMIDMDTRKPVDLFSLHGGKISDYVCNEECPIEKPGRIKLSNPEFVGTYQAKYSDIDLNGHVNSIKYIEHILDLFPLDLLCERAVRRFEIAYVAESFYGDMLTFLREKDEKNAYNVEIKRNETDVVVRSRIIFN